MRSIIVFMQHGPNNVPGYLSDYFQMKKLDCVVFKLWLDSHWKKFPCKVSEVICCVPEEGKPHVWQPTTTDEERGEEFRICAVASGGGHMSANDGLPHYPSIFTLLRDCVATRTPYIGHCLGAQLLSLALGGKVTRATQPECTWVSVTPHNRDKWESLGIKKWFVDEPTSTFFAFHGETFSIPEGCHLIATGETCYNQAFQVGDQYIIGTQFHPEVTMDNIRNVCRLCSLCPSKAEVEQMSTEEKERRLPSSVMTKEELLECAPSCIEENRRFSTQMYDVWTSEVLRRIQE